jgi:hypothetical protein
LKKLRQVTALISVLALLFAVGTTVYAADSAEAVVQQAITLPKEAIVVPEGSTVVITDVTVIPASSEVIASLIEQVKGLTFQPESTILMDIQATGSGAVTFNVGVQNAGKAVACLHFNETANEWESLGVANVDAAGNVTFIFSSFSPVALFISASAEIPTEVVSPKTGETNMILFIEFLAIASIAVLIVTVKKVKKI